MYMQPKYVYSLKGIAGTMLSIMEVLWKYKVSVRLITKIQDYPAYQNTRWVGRDGTGQNTNCSLIQDSREQASASMPAAKQCKETVLKLNTKNGRWQTRQIVPMSLTVTVHHPAISHYSSSKARSLTACTSCHLAIWGSLGLRLPQSEASCFWLRVSF